MLNQKVINTYGGVGIQVSIINDDILEEMVESFTTILTSLTPRLNLSPGMATVDIIDNDRKSEENTLFLSGHASICPSSCYVWI